jgi:subtilisin-like proprotein convertase family protein
MNLLLLKSGIMQGRGHFQPTRSRWSHPLLLIAVLGAFMPLEMRADYSNTYSFSVGQTIPDNDPTGIAITEAIAGANTRIDRLQVSLNIAGGYNGDLYAYLYFTNSVQQSSAFAVLLNRSGRTATDSSGYADSGLNVTFDDQAPNGDIHNYQNVVNPDGGTLTGYWQPDARNVSPDVSLDTAYRSADLSNYIGLDPNGSWTLFVEDNSALGVANLQSWAVTVTMVPEPTTSNLAAVAGFLSLVYGRSRLRKRHNGRGKV